jgi:hypothetical protein
VICQNDVRLPERVHHFGCYYVALNERLTTLFDLPFTVDGLLDCLLWGEANGSIDDRVTMADPQAICDHVVGRGRVRYWGKFPATRWCEDREFEILVFHRDGASFSHYVSGNGRGVVIYDPWFGGSLSVKKGRLVGKRIYRIAA